MKKSILKWLIKWFIIKMNLYLIWSKINQKLFQKNREPLPKLRHLGELMEIIGTSKWTADTWWMLWDAIAHPEYAYYNYKHSGMLGDCDDHAVFSAHYTQQWYIDTRVLSIQWLDKAGKFHGHNICIFYREEQKNLITFISNGYNVAVTLRNFQRCLDAFVRDGEILSWFTFKPDLSEITDYFIY